MTTGRKECSKILVGEPRPKLITHPEIQRVTRKRRMRHASRLFRDSGDGLGVQRRNDLLVQATGEKVRSRAYTVLGHDAGPIRQQDPFW